MGERRKEVEKEIGSQTAGISRIMGRGEIYIDSDQDMCCSAGKILRWERWDCGNTSPLVASPGYMVWIFRDVCLLWHDAQEGFRGSSLWSKATVQKLDECWRTYLGP